MYFGLYKPARVIESKGPDFFIPAHPEPRQTEPNIFTIVLGARHSLIGNLMEDRYHSGVDSFRVLTRQIVFVNSPEHVKYVMVSRHANYERKSPQMRRALAPLIGDGLVISDGETWKWRRPIVAGVVHKKRMPEFAPTMEEVAEEFARGWAELPEGTGFELTHQMAQLTAKIIAQTVFGRNLGHQAAHMLIDGFASYQKSVDSFNLGYFLGADEGWPLLLGPKRRRAAAMVHTVVDGVLDAHFSGQGDRGSMVDMLIKHRADNSGPEMDRAALRNEAATMFLAGHETTAALLTWAWYLIANSPWVEERLHVEIDMVCGEGPVRMSDLPALDWCRAIILETLRLYPPIPLLPRQAKDADRIGDIDVEKGALVMISPWLLHRARDLWDRPNHFMPERFANGGKADPFTFIPFSVGPRTCAGLNFGLDEAILCLATLAQRFRVLPRQGWKVEPVCRLTLRPQGGLPVTIAARSGKGRP